MKYSISLILILLFCAGLPSVYAAPALAQGSFAQYNRVSSSPSGTLNGTYRWDVQAVSGESPLAKILVENNQSTQIANFTIYIDLASRIEIPSYTVASQNPQTGQPSTGTDHPTKTFFWIEPNPPLGSVIDTVLGSAFVNGTETIILRSGTVKNCWTLVSQSSGTSGFSGRTNATLRFWYDQQTGLLVKLNSETSNGPFNKVSDILLLEKTNINSVVSLPLTLTAVEWASLTMAIIALILSGIAVAVAIDLRHFRRKKTSRE